MSDLLLPDSRIVEFLKEHHVATIAIGNGADLWCWHAFYTYLQEENVMLFTSETKTRHIKMVLEGNSHVTGGVALETEKIGTIRGAQFRATIEPCEGSLLNEYRLKYLRRFPYAILKGGDLWLLRLYEIKFTDNRLGFGKKIIFQSSL